MMIGDSGSHAQNPVKLLDNNRRQEPLSDELSNRCLSLCFQREVNTRVLVFWEINLQY